MKNKQKKQFKHLLNIQMFAEDTLLEMMQARAQKIDRQETILKAARSENDRDLTTDEDQEFEKLESEILALDQKIQARKTKEERESKVAARAKELLQPIEETYRPSALGGLPVQQEKKDDAGFASLGEMFHALRYGDPKGRILELKVSEGQGGGRQVPEAFRDQLMSFRNEWKVDGTGGAGNFLPTQFRPDTVLQINAPVSIVRPRATIIPAGDPPDSKITIPALTQGSNGVFGGVEVQWIEEGGNKPETDGSMEEVTLQPHEVAATTVVTDKLLRNWQAADSFIRTLLQRSMIAAEDIAFLTGSGTGKPLGVLNAKGALAVNRQVANQITYLDVVNMLAQLLPESVGNASFVAHQSTLPQLLTMKDDAGRYIFIQGDATRGIPSTLMGIPIQFTGRTKPLGTKGDLQLIDFMYFLIKDGSGPYIDASEHVLFRQNKTVIKAFWNVDGTPWVIEPLTLEDGITKVSPYVVLDIPKP
ncbi:phage major capsid protein [Paenibacillus alvei]|uniref:Phage major capsid protein n=1 Tax=Paenibacillus alvei TaxID=44250 RepID=A0ABT4GR93_PAEAL|nr:phage major capsid protein [Paenibacillus alvei]MCY9758967.1 phage major capsid protein [Paenibacillus alvei]MCY9770640.1 phage major capsid protein [Paenibacillus alvei]